MSGNLVTIGLGHGVSQDGNKPSSEQMLNNPDMISYMEIHFNKSAKCWPGQHFADMLKCISLTLPFNNFVPGVNELTPISHAMKQVLAAMKRKSLMSRAQTQMDVKLNTNQ